MKILVIGAGGREHALCRQFDKSEKTSMIYCAPGNAGIAEIAECVDIKPEDVNALAEFAARHQIDLTFVGGETALALGIADEFERRGMNIIGASRHAAELEASKSFAKDFMHRHQIPTAAYLTAFSTAEAKEILEAGEFGGEDTPVVVKADGLAAGKGVVVAKNRAEAVSAVGELENLAGKNAASKIVLEECLFGKEVSLLLFADGENFALMPPVRDHKRIFDNDLGANTGGMGTFTDDNLLSGQQISEIVERIIKPTLEGCRSEGFPFRGILFLGLMMTAAGAKLLEYNVRFGDPETQAIMVRLKTDLIEICEAILEQRLDEIRIEWQPGNSACIVLAAENYPQKPRVGDVIDGLKNAREIEDVVIFHAGTSRNKNGEIVTAGGRVLGVTATADNLAQALNKAYQAAAEIKWKGMQYRRDIGK